MLYGIAKVIRRIARPKLEVSPTLDNVILNPDATPRLFAGTEPITELILGETQRPDPMPKTASPTRIVVTPVAEFTKAKMRKATLLTAKPVITKILDPYLSDSLPAIGPTAMNPASSASKRIPV